MRAWFGRHHADTPELWVGFYKKGTGLRSVTYPEAVDQALCYGWIDGVRHSIDDTSYTNRFTPRKARSNWSAVNIKRIAALRRAGQMAAPGLKAFLERDPSRAGMPRAERPGLSPRYQKLFKADAGAWAFFRAQAPWYQRVAGYWVGSAKQEATRERRLAQLMRDSAAGRRLAMLTAKKKVP